MHGRARSTCTQLQLDAAYACAAVDVAADEGKSCSEWLMEIQSLHARKQELSSQQA